MRRTFPRERRISPVRSCHDDRLPQVSPSHLTETTSVTRGDGGRARRLRGDEAAPTRDVTGAPPRHDAAVAVATRQPVASPAASEEVRDNTRLNTYQGDGDDDDDDDHQRPDGRRRYRPTRSQFK